MMKKSIKDVVESTTVKNKATIYDTTDSRKGAHLAKANEIKSQASILNISSAVENDEITKANNLLTKQVRNNLGATSFTGKTKVLKNIPDHSFTSAVPSMESFGKEGHSIGVSTVGLDISTFTLDFFFEL